MLPANSAFAFLKFVDLTPGDISAFHSLPTIARQLRILQLERRGIELEPFKECVSFWWS